MMYLVCEYVTNGRRVIEYYDRSNFIKQIDFDGDVFEREYDENGNKIKEIDNGELICSITIE